MKIKEQIEKEIRDILRLEDIDSTRRTRLEKSELLKAKLQVIESYEKEILEMIENYCNEEIEYLENHVREANKGIKINVEMVNSWIHQTKKIKRELKSKIRSE